MRDFLAVGRQRAVIEGIEPSVDHGRFAIKRVIDEPVVVEADVFTDGHDQVVALLRHRPAGRDTWVETPMEAMGNDRFQGRFTPSALGRWEYTVCAWVDGFLSWLREFNRRREDADIRIALKVGTELLTQAAERARDNPADGAWLTDKAAALQGDLPLAERRALALDPALTARMNRYPDRHLESEYPVHFPVVVDDARARFSTWYELFPRSQGLEGHHGTLKDVEERLVYVAEMGFDVLYLPPIHPIGRVNRKGKNNTLTPTEDDVGSPWAIGAAEGGHKALHPALGNVEDFKSLVAAAKGHGIEIALDVAFQCAPDHPYVGEHPAWFRWRPDGTVQYAENPPKKYQDIYPFHFESDDWQTLFAELKSIFEHWLSLGVRIFRVDNPHTKPFPFWEWVITELKRDHPAAIFLSEAFTRPKVMHRLAKLGFTQSYTYFTWRNTKRELTHYLTELTATRAVDYYRPNFWPNTPDILPEYLQFGGRPAFVIRLILAATLTASYGIYGPAFELFENTPRESGGEEYLDSEKYQLRHRDLERPDSLKSLIARINRIRRENPALQDNRSLVFHTVDNEEIISYSKLSPEGDNAIVVVANVDPFHTQSGWVELPLERFGLDDQRPYQVHDLLTNARYLWHGRRNYVELNSDAPAHIFRLRRRVRTERDFDYYL
ncbi:MAG: alpha-1,4-glucan--maltose-1-phosphate maltosyltransferase [Candidatus Competibacterales bacterium]